MPDPKPPPTPPREARATSPRFPDLRPKPRADRKPETVPMQFVQLLASVLFLRAAVVPTGRLPWLTLPCILHTGLLAAGCLVIHADRRNLLAFHLYLAPILLQALGYSIT